MNPYPFGHISDHPAEYDPMGMNWAMAPIPQGTPAPAAQPPQYGFSPMAPPPQYAPVSMAGPPQYGFAPMAQPSLPSLPAQSYGGWNQEIPLGDIYRYMCPISPLEQGRTVIGVQTDGTNTANKKYLKGIYQAAGLSLCCHSCGERIVEKTGWVFGRPISIETVIGDHQPPTALYTAARSMAGGFFPLEGKLSKAVKAIQQSPLTLYIFKADLSQPGGKSKGLFFQTNNYYLARRLGRTEPQSVIYGDPSQGQFLYPHCKKCSDRQGRLLQ